jgi:hypothetical protein
MSECLRKAGFAVEKLEIINGMITIIARNPGG